MIEKFTATYIKRRKWYIGTIEEISGVNTQGKTLAETKKNLKEALRRVLEANKELERIRKKTAKIGITQKDIDQAVRQVRKSSRRILS